MSNKVFEQIAREGRKFGLGLLLSSQRPSALSPTVLSQCNTFILHRLTNDIDQKLIKGLLPDTLGDMLDELPILPTRNAFILGWASPLPILTEIRELDLINQPKSADPNYWDVWVGKNKREINWLDIADNWHYEGIGDSKKEYGTESEKKDFDGTDDKE